ncbi:mitochondrial inner membrane protease subunit 2 isoform X2 [Octopus sinensis]|nr:mitochondrial inner membrane protease subunit 2 isoform X2 [Octopus sinensis]
MLRVALGTAVTVAPMVIFFHDNIGFIAKVEGASMQPALNPEGQRTSDYVFLNKWKAKNHHYIRGEVVSLISPRNPHQKLVKRIIALEGDNIRTLGYKEKMIEIPKGHCWMEGDNYRKSMDSNYFGPVPKGLITAKVSHIIWPPYRWQSMEVIHTNHRRVRPRRKSLPSS